MLVENSHLVPQYSRINEINNENDRMHIVKTYLITIKIYLVLYFTHLTFYNEVITKVSFVLYINALPFGCRSRTVSTCFMVQQLECQFLFPAAGHL